MKSIVKVTGLIALASAAFFAINAGSALAAPPPPDGIGPQEIAPIDLCILLGTCDDGLLEPMQPCWVNDTCGLLEPIDPCMFLGNCSSDNPGDDEDSSEEEMIIEPTATPTDEPTDEPTATPTDEPTATPTGEPTATATTEPTDQPTDTPPTDTPPTAQPQPGNLPHAGDNGEIISGVNNGVVLLAGFSLVAMALAWVMLLASRKTQAQR